MSEFQKPSCPECGEKEPVRHAKDTGEWYCWRKVGGCGAKWQPGVKAAAAAPPPPSRLANTVSEIIFTPDPPAVKAEPEPPKSNGSGWKRDPEEGRLIVRQTALKAAVEFAAAHPTEDVLLLADTFVAWVYGEAVEAAAATKSSPPPAQPKANYVAHLRDGEDIGTAARRALAEHDPLAGVELADEEPPHPADTWEGATHPRPVRETLRAGAPRR